MYRYYNGEAENPFPEGSICRFYWFYESKFEEAWALNESSDWYAFFSDWDLGRNFLQLLREEDYERPRDKVRIFDLWLEYLFTEKLSGSLEAEYFASAVYKDTGYKYYKGEETCPFANDTGASVWWRIESYAAENGDEKLPGRLSRTMIEYLRERVWQSDSGWDTTWDEASKRATIMYNRGIWDPSFLNDKDRRLEI